MKEYTNESYAIRSIELRPNGEYNCEYHVIDTTAKNKCYKDTVIAKFDTYAEARDHIQSIVDEKNKFDTLVDSHTRVY